MPRPIVVQNAFTTGEIAPGAAGRTDLDKYNSSLTCCSNFTPDPLGGLIRRPGTRFVCETKLSQFSSRLLPFQFSVTQAYILEAGCQYVRFYKSNAQILDAAEKVSNGTFDTSISSWTPTNNGQWSSNFGGSALLPTSLNSTITQDVTVTAGVAHTLSVSNPGTVSYLLAVGSATGLGDLVNATLIPTGTYTFSVTSTTTTVSIFAKCWTSNNAYVDNVSLQPSGGALELTVPYDQSQLRDIDVVQSADEQYFLHACHPTRKLSRYADNCWRFNCVAFSPLPSTEYGAREQSDVQAGALGGNNVTFTAFNNDCAFMVADAGREIRMISGANAGARAGVKTVLDGRRAVVNICVPFATTAINCAGTWILTGSPLTTITPADNKPEGKSTTLTLTAAGWRVGGTSPGETDVGKFVHLNGGTYELTCVSSTTVARALIHSEAQSKDKGEAGAWSLEEALWSCNRGFAQCGDFFEDRLWLDAGFRFVGSKTGDYENFASGVLDDDAVQFAVNSKTINAIRSIIGGRQLQLFTTGGEFVALGATDSPITPTAIRLSSETTHGASGVTPIRIGDVTVFLTRFGRQLREFTQRADVVSDAYAAPDLLLLASHLTRDAGIVEMAYQREPNSTIWAVRSDGVLLSCAYRREENVVAWAKHYTCGSFESVAVIPHPDGDREQVWVIVNRTINGATKRYVEYLDDSTLTYDRRLTDASVTYNNCVATKTFTCGLNHLECATVQILADGKYVGTCVVAQGRVGIVTAANKVEIGLPYISELITSQPEAGGPGQSIQPMRKRWARLFVRTKDSCNLTVRTSGTSFETLPAGQSMGDGILDHDVSKLGNFYDARITVRQDQPLPAHILLVGGVLDLGDA